MDDIKPMNKIYILFITLYFPVMAFGQAQRPNVLLIMTDQQNAKMMSCAGNEWLNTPNIDRLAARGMRFEKAYVTNPVCSPSRFSMFTGLYPSVINMRHNKSELDEEKLSQIIPGSIGFTFKSAGYETYYGGKVHLPSGGNNAYNYGFDNLITMDQRDDLADKSAEFLLNRKSDAPFLYVVSLINPHDICFEAIRQHQPESKAAKITPHQLLDAIQIPDSLSEEEFYAGYCPPLPDNFEPSKKESDAIYELEELHPFTIYARENWDEKDWRRHRWAYHRLTESVDEQIGRVLDALEKSGVRDNTIVIFTSDHGEMSASHRLEHKTVFYEESSNIPLIVWYEGIKNSGAVDDQHLISNGLDLYPTLCELTGIKIPEGLQGISFAPLLNGENYNGRKYLILENEIGFMIRDFHMKYAVYDNGSETLFDTEKDPGEMKNIAGHPKYKKEQKILRKHLLDYLAKGEIVY